MKKLLLYLFTFISLTSFAQIDLVNDFTNDSKNGTPIFLGTYKNEVYLTALNASYQTEVYKYNGTDLIRFKDVNNTPFDAFTYPTVFNNDMYFYGRIGTSFNFYKYDGTNFTNLFDGYAYIPVAYNNKIFFAGNTGGFGEKNHLWVTNGAENDAQKVKEVELYSNSKNHLWKFVEANNTLFFVGKTADAGIELWKTDGTEAGTVMVKDINIGTSDADPEDFFIASNGLLYFSAKTQTEGRELWVSDGTESGTVMLKDFYSGTAGGDFYLSEINNKVIIVKEDGAADVLYETDGTVAGTTTLTDVIKGDKVLLNTNGLIYFHGSKSGESGDFFVTDGTNGGTRVLKSDLNVDKNVMPVLFKNEIYFNGDFGSDGEELWKTDGTEAGTVMVKDVGSGSITDAYPKNLTVLGDELIFVAKQHGNTGDELWRTDGTEAGTEIIQDLNPGSGGISLHQVYKFDNSLLLRLNANTGSGTEFYKYSNGTTAFLEDFEADNLKLHYSNKSLKIFGLENQKATVKIFNILGKEILQKTISERKNVIAINQKTGVYFALIKTNDGKIVSKKFLIQ